MRKEKKKGKRKRKNKNPVSIEEKKEKRERKRREKWRKGKEKGREQQPNSRFPIYPASTSYLDYHSHLAYGTFSIPGEQLKGTGEEKKEKTERERKCREGKKNGEEN